MFHYEKMFEPFTADGATIEGSIAWLKKTTGADQSIIDQAIAETMDMLASGEKFECPCQCGCGGTPNNIHTPINHFMLRTAQRIQKDVAMVQIEIIKDRQKRLIESQLKKLSTFEKDYYKANTTWSERNIPTFRKLFVKDKK